MFNRPIIQFFRNRFILVLIPRIIVAIFIILQIIGMMVYPGGTIHDEATVGYSFSNNFFSDLGIYTAYNGEPNYLSMSLFMISLIFVGITFIFYYMTLPQFYKDDSLNFKLSILGTLFAFGGSIGLIGTALTPADLVLDMHVFFANGIFKCFMITALCYTIVISRSNVFEKKYAWGYGVFFILIALYVGVLEWAPPPRSSQPALVFQVITQKLIVLTFCLAIVYQTFGFSKSKILL